MCTTLFYYTCVYMYSLLNSCGYWNLNKYYYYYIFLKTLTKIVLLLCKEICIHILTKAIYS